MSATNFPRGWSAITPGVYNTNSDSVRITIYGKGGHGSMPQSAIDPIVIAARTILALQTIVSREIKPGEMAVVTVGYIQAGTKNNIIPDHAEMGLTIRTRKPEVRQQILAAITRIAKAEAAAAGAPREPLVERYEGTDLVYNNPALAERLRAPLEAALGKDKVVTGEPITPSEDFSYFVNQGVPGFYFSLGGADPEKFAAAKASGTSASVESLCTVRARRGSRAARGDRGRGCRVEEFAECVAGRTAEAHRGALDSLKSPAGSWSTARGSFDFFEIAARISTSSTSRKCAPASPYLVAAARVRCLPEPSGSRACHARL